MLSYVAIGEHAYDTDLTAAGQAPLLQDQACKPEHAALADHQEEQTESRPLTTPLPKNFSTSLRGLNTRQAERVCAANTEEPAFARAGLKMPL